MYVQYCCGFCAPSGWRNFDASPTLYFERIPLIGMLYTKNKTRFPKNVEYGNIVKGLPIPEGGCEAVYCSHILEHLSLLDFRLALKNTWRILKPGGRFRLVMPDLENHIWQYTQNSTPEAAILFMEATCLGHKTRPRSVSRALLEAVGSNYHLWLWDYKSLMPELLKAGFVNIRRARFNDSEDPRFKEVEEQDRWDNLGVECFRPE